MLEPTTQPLWYDDWQLITHVVDSHITFKILSLPNARAGQKVFVFEINDTLDLQLKALLETTEGLLIELTSKIKSDT